MKHLFSWTRLIKLDIYIFLTYVILPILFYFQLFSIDGVIAPGDGLASYVPMRGVLETSLHEFSFPAWGEYLNLGDVFYAEMQSAVFYLPNLLFYSVLPFSSAFNYLFIFHLTLAGFFTYKYLTQVKLSSMAAFLGGLSFMFCGTLNAKFGHVTIFNSIIWLPLILYFYELFMMKFKKRFLVYMAIAFAMQFFAGFIQISVYTSIILLFYFIWSYKRFRSWKQWLFSKIHFFIISIGFILIQLYSTFILSASVGRDEVTYDFFVSYSLPPIMLITLLFPNFFGVNTPSQPFGIYNQPYWGPENLTEYAIYIGIIPVFFFVSSLFQRRKNRFNLFWSFIVVFALLFAMGSYVPFISKLTYNIPLLNMFRVPSRFLFIFAFGASVLFANKINDYFTSDKKQQFIEIRKTMIITASILFLIVTIVHSLLSIYSKSDSVPLLSDDYYSFLNPIIAIPFVIMAMSIIVLYLIIRLKKKNVVFGVLVMVLIIDLHTFSFYHEKVFVQPINSNPIIEYLNENNDDNGRVWPIANNYEVISKLLIFPNENMKYKIPTINGYATFLSNDYKQWTGFNERGLNSNYIDLLANNYKLSLLATKYIVIPADKEVEIETINKADFSELKLISEVSRETLYSNAPSYSLLFEEVPIKSNQIYKLVFQTVDNIDEEVYLDLYGTNYDNEEQQLTANDGNSFSKYIFTGADVPSDVLFRVFSYGERDIAINKAAIYEVGTNKRERMLYEKKFEYGGNLIYENTNYFNKLFVVNAGYELNENEVKKNIELNDHTIIQDDQIDNIQYRSGFISGEANVSEESLVVFSEHMYPGWKAFVNGESTEIIKVNNYIQGIVIPKGKSHISFIYKSNDFLVGGGGILFSLLYILLIMKFPFTKIISRINRFKKRGF